MKLTDVRLGLARDSLKEVLTTDKSERKPIAEGLIYEKTCLMISADPGLGKSTVSTQVAVELAAGLPIFGFFHVPKPTKVLYSQNERHIYETIERLKLLDKTIPINTDNLVITDEYQKLNMLKEEHAELLLACILRDCPEVEVIFFDPIYSMVRGGLSKDEPASAFTKAMALIEKETGAAAWWNHHTVKTEQVQGKTYERDDPFYGSQWIKAHITGGFHMKKGQNGVVLDRKKDNYGILTKHIELDYNHETGLCSVESDNIQAIDKLKHYLRVQFMTKKEFTFEEMRVSIQLSTAMLRRLLVDRSFENAFSVRKGLRNKNFYTVERVDF